MKKPSNTLWMGQYRFELSVSRQKRGNAIPEYVLIGALLCLVSIAAFLVLGQSFSGKISDVKKIMHTQIDASITQAAQIATAKALYAKESGTLASDASGASYGNAMTTGANGSTLGSSGISGSAGLGGMLSNLSEGEKNLVKDVANTAHEIARMQEILEQISKYSAGDMDKFRNTIVIFDGETLTAYQLAMKLGQGGLAAQLQDKKNSLLSSGATDAVKDKVAVLSDQVQADATKTSDKTTEVLVNNTDPTQVDQVSDSAATDQKATGICNTTGGSDNGSTCQG